ncbi:MAG: MerR family transcriptional regulator [Clostridia bacterium]|nr:MerR family transcriptional regulator [Clostridia bacterium]
MMTIKEFATLCGCNTQTLRYYDKIDLLKPVKVDQWSGYRYYTKSQAIDFVKIKNLQAADFTIDEIKALLIMPDQQVFEAFDQKIAEQAQKLERIKEIQQSYLTEKTNMEKLVQSASDYLFHAVSDFEMLREFGMSPTDGETVIAKLKEFYERTALRHLPASPDVQMILNGSAIQGTQQMIEAFESLKENGYKDTVLLGDQDVGKTDTLTPENSETVWECHGWNFVYEFLDNIPELQKGYEHCFYFLLTEEKHPNKMEFPMFMIAAMLPKLDTDDIRFGCSVEHSNDGQNHFVLLRRK